MTDPKRRRALCILLWSLTALWLACIWSMSAQTGAESGGLSARLAAWLLPWADGRTLAAFELLLRKLAHMTEYAVLACLFSLALLSSRMPHPVHFAFIFSILAAIADECHQLFVPGRAGQAEFWLWILVMFIVSTVLGFVPKIGSILSLIWTLAMLLPSLGVTARRLHDRNKSGWTILITLIPFIGALILLIMCIPEGDKDENKFGSAIN